MALVSSKVPDYNLYDKMKKNYMESPVITNNNLLENNDNTSKFESNSQKEESKSKQPEIIGEI